MRTFTAALLLTLLPVSVHADQRDVLYGPISADVVRVRDGDSIDVRAHIWPGQTIEVSVRLRGIDAPELRARCSKELILAKAAKRRLEELVSKGRVQLRRISGGKYYGRVLAQVETRHGRNVQTILIQESLVRSYRGGKRQSWCGADTRLTGSTGN